VRGAGRLRYTDRVTGISGGVDYHVDVAYDDEAGVWVVTSPDVIGLTLEYGSLDRLDEQLLDAVTELLDLNGQPAARQVDVAMTRHVRAPAYA